MIRTEALLVVKGPMQPHDTGVAASEAHQRVLLRDGGVCFVVALQMGFVEDFDGVLLFGRRVDSEVDLARMRV